jgi:hypothetical protein
VAHAGAEEAGQAGMELNQPYTGMLWPRLCVPPGKETQI